MEETMIWVTGLIAEILLVVAAVFAVLLRRSRKAQQQLLAQLANQANHPAEPIVATEIPTATPEGTPDAPSADIESSEVEAELPEATDVLVTNEFDQLLVSIDNAKLDESVGRLRQRLETLQRLASELQQDPTSSGQGHPEVEALQVSLLEMTQEIDSLQQSNDQLKHEVRHKTQVMELTAAKERDHKEMVLQHAKKLRGNVAALRDKLKNSEGDVQRLQSEKAALATEFAALNKEYERIYAKDNT